MNGQGRQASRRPDNALDISNRGLSGIGGEVVRIER